MEQRALQSGEVIFREGEESEEAFRILSGKVQISINTKSGPRVLSQLYPGEIFGEMGMVDDQPRSATAIASKQTVIEVITMDKFIEYIMSDHERLSAYLGTVFERLRVSDLKLQMALRREAETEYIGRNDHTLDDVFFGSPIDEPEEETPKRTLRLVSTSESAESIEAVIEKFPFRIGRLDVIGESSPFGNNDLSIPDGEPYQISRNHCAIEEHSGRFFVRDRGSTLGTIVNGNPLIKRNSILSEELVPGENTMVLGREDSSHAFSITVS